MCFPLLLFGHEGESKQIPTRGNLSLPPVTQIGPLVSFGQLLIGEKALLPEFSGVYYETEEGYLNTLAPNVIYGIKDNLSVYFVVPFTPKSRSGSFHSSGMEDVFLQLEYGYFSRSGSDYTLQGTIVGNVQFPTGSSKKFPPTGFGSFSYFVGTTFSYLSTNWYAFVSPGVNITKKFGNAYLYEWGFGRYIDQLSPPGWVFDLLFEFDGTYVDKTGSNLIFLTPSIWLSSERWIFQFGAGWPILQKLHGVEDKLLYSLNYTVGVAFQF